MKRVNVNVDQMQLFVIINNVELKINIDANVRNSFTKVYAIKDMLGMPVIANANVLSHVILVSIQITKIVSVKKGWQIN